LFKSLKLWSFYTDMEESIGSVESTKAIYDKIMELKIANAQVIVNYANFLEENKYWEESFKVYERGIELFSFPIAFEIWNIYLSKFVKRYAGKKLERARDLFEQALENCPEKFCKPLFLMYAKLEEEHGLAKRAMGIYDRAATTVQASDKFDMFSIYIAKATANFGLPATRPIYERAIESLPDKQTAEMCRRFARMERKLGEIDRARAILAHASQFCDPRIEPEFWAEWNAFESKSILIALASVADYQSIPDRKIHSEKCSESSEPSRHLSTPKTPSLPLKLLLQQREPQNPPMQPSKQQRTLQTPWPPWNVIWLVMETERLHPNSSLRRKLRLTPMELIRQKEQREQRMLILMLFRSMRTTYNLCIRLKP
jgi:hypothetical protein